MNTMSISYRSRSDHAVPVKYSPWGTKSHVLADRNFGLHREVKILLIPSAEGWSENWTDSEQKHI